MKKTILARKFLFVLAIGAPLVVGTCLAAQPEFSVQVLGNLSGGRVTNVNGINNAGEAVGGAGGGSSVCPTQCAVIWHDGTPAVLGAVTSFAEYVTYGTSINDASQVAGIAYMTNTVANMAVIWNNGTPTLLPGAGSQSGLPTFAYAINEAGQVVGSDNSGEELHEGAIVWNGTTPTVLDSPAGCTEGSYATSINDKGVVAGLSYCGTQLYSEVTVWHGTTAKLLGDGKPFAINNAGLVVGYGKYGATAWANGVAISLGILPGGTTSSALAVSNRGIIVGTSTVPGEDFIYRAVLWSSTSAAPQDLNTLVSAKISQEYIIGDAVGINDKCTIVANGYSRKNTIVNVAFLLKLTDPSLCVNGGL